MNDSESNHTGYVYLGLKGDFDPHQFAKDIPLKPNKCAAKHSRDELRKIPRTSLLRYAQQSTDAALIDISALAEKAVEILEPHQTALASAILLHDAEATFQVVVWFPTSEEVSTPILVFSKRVISFIASVGASIDIDTYRGG